MVVCALWQVGGGMVGGGQYITMSGQQAVTIPVVGSVQGHIPSIGHVVQVSRSGTQHNTAHYKAA